jgi:hypothetical protein
VFYAAIPYFWAWGWRVRGDIHAIWQGYNNSETLDSIYGHDRVGLLTWVVGYGKRGEVRLDLGEFA